MPTPEEQKSKLQANRLARSVSSTPSPSSAMVSRQPRDRRSALQSSRLRASTLVAALALAPLPSNQTPQQEETLQSDASWEDDSDQQTQAQQAQRLAGIQAGLMVQRQQQSQLIAEKAQQEEQTQKEQQQQKRLAKAILKRGMIYVLSILSAPILMVNVFVWIFTLGWLNLEMIYGKYLTKGKGRYVDPISWEPIPMAIDKEALILQGFVVAANLAFGIAVLMSTFGSFCLIHDFVQITGSVAGAVQTGTLLAQGQNGGLCLGGILSSTFGP